ncbi:hypothetical protein GCM10007928_00500 [Sulfitobacter porphyrae]|nr:hypothetical protein GCM10007928_00500 [Sulfitobacter porphyrae]
MHPRHRAAQAGRIGVIPDPRLNAPGPEGGGILFLAHKARDGGLRGQTLQMIKHELAQLAARPGDKNAVRRHLVFLSFRIECKSHLETAKTSRKEASSCHKVTPKEPRPGKTLRR